jgi:hypothetical protein
MAGQQLPERQKSSCREEQQENERRREMMLHPEQEEPSIWDQIFPQQYHSLEEMKEANNVRRRGYLLLKERPLAEACLSEDQRDAIIAEVERAVRLVNESFVLEKEPSFWRKVRRYITVLEDIMRKKNQIGIFQYVFPFLSHLGYRCPQEGLIVSPHYLHFTIMHILQQVFVDLNSSESESIFTDQTFRVRDLTTCCEGAEGNEAPVDSFEEWFFPLEEPEVRLAERVIMCATGWVVQYLNHIRVEIPESARHIAASAPQLYGDNAIAVDEDRYRADLRSLNELWQGVRQYRGANPAIQSYFRIRSSLNGVQK